MPRHGQPPDADRDPHRRRRHDRPRRRQRASPRVTCASPRWATSTSSTRSSACCSPSRLPDDVRELLVVIQHELFNLGGELSIPGYALLKAEAVARLDDALAHYNAALPRLKEFILPAGTRSAALAHVGRTVARRAERAVVALAGSDEVRAEAAPVPEPAERPAVRAGARAQPRQPRRTRRRRRVLAERAPRARCGGADTPTESAPPSAVRSALREASAAASKAMRARCRRADRARRSTSRRRRRWRAAGASRRPWRSPSPRLR